MIFINKNVVFKKAVLKNNLELIENILASSDSRIDLIEEFSNNEDINLLIKKLPKFKSSGLISDIENILNLIKAKKSYIDKYEKNSKPMIIKTVNLKNIEINKMKYLQEDTFLKNKISKKAVNTVKNTLNLKKLL